MGNKYSKVHYSLSLLFSYFCCSLTVYLFRSKTNALNICQKMIEMFVRTKHKIDKRHEFALVVVNDDALWVSRKIFQLDLNIMALYSLQHIYYFLEYCLFICSFVCVCMSLCMQLSGFTSDPRELCSCLYDLETNVCESFSILLARANSS